MARPPVPIQRTIRVGESHDSVKERFLDYFTDWFGQGTWQVMALTADSVTYGRRFFHTWQIVVAILLFPIGLIALLAEKGQYSITATFATVDSESSVVTVSGSLPDNNIGQQIADRIDEFDPATVSPGSGPARTA